MGLQLPQNQMLNLTSFIINGCPTVPGHISPGSMFAIACQLHRFVSLIQSKPHQPLSCGAGSTVSFCQLLSDPCLTEISPAAPILLL